jgi:predicted nucleotide-binding protein
MTPDDEGQLKGTTALAPRARQNVVFELGFFIGKLGPDRVCALVAGELDKPSDFDAVVYIQFGSNTSWRTELARELRAANIPFDYSKVF